MADTSGAGDDPPDKHFSFRKWICHYPTIKKKSRNSGPQAEGEQEERKKRSANKILACFKPSTSDDARSEEVGGRRSTEVRVSLPRVGRLDANELRGMGSEGLMNNANGSSSNVDPSRMRVTLRGGVPAKRYYFTRLTEVKNRGESSTQDAQHGTSSIQHGEEAFHPISSPLLSTQPPSPNAAHAYESFHQHGGGSAQSPSAVSAPASVDQGQSFTQSLWSRCEVASCSNLRGQCPQHAGDEEE